MDTTDDIDENMQEYLFFCYILSNDKIGLDHLLTSGISVPRTLNFCIIECFDAQLTNGIFQNADYSQAYQWFLRKIKDFDTIVNKINKMPYLIHKNMDEIHVMEFVCMLGHYHNSFEIFDLLLQQSISLDYIVVTRIVCFSMTQSEAVYKLLTSLGHDSDNGRESRDLSVRVLSNLLFFAGRCNDDVQRISIRFKTKSILEAIRQSSNLNAVYFECVKHCLELSVVIKDSSLLKYLLKNLSNDKNFEHEISGDVYFKERLFESALQNRAYYIAFLLIKANLGTVIKSFRNCPMVSLYQIFLILKQKCLRADVVLGTSDNVYIDRNSLFLWLYVCFSKDTKKPKAEKLSILVNVIRYSRRQGKHLGRYLDLLIRCGVDIDAEIEGKIAPILQAVHKQNLFAIRVLLYHGCKVNDLKNQDHSDDRPPIVYYNFPIRQQRNSSLTCYCFKILRYDLLRVLWLSGACSPFGIAWYRTPPMHRRFYEHPSGKYKEEGTWVKFQSKKPKLLSCLCRDVLRHHYGRGLNKMLDELEYPHVLKQFLRTELLLLEPAFEYDTCIMHRGTNGY